MVYTESPPVEREVSRRPLEGVVKNGLEPHKRIGALFPADGRESHVPRVNRDIIIERKQLLLNTRL